MFLVLFRISCFVLIANILSIKVTAQSAPIAKPRIEPGLEEAVKWSWSVQASDEKDWGFSIKSPEQETEMVKAGVPAITPTTTIKPIEIRPTEYSVKSGDALGLISRKYGMSVLQLKTFNGLTKDTIRVGQILKIPTLEEIKAMMPPPPPEPKVVEKMAPKVEKKEPILTREVEAKHQTHRQVLQLRPETVDSKWMQILLFMLFRTQIREISTFLLLDKK